MAKLQKQLGAIVQADPDVASVPMALGVGVGNTAQNNGKMFITLKPRDERDADAFQIINRLRPKLAQVKGVRLYLQVAQDVNVGARAARTQFQYDSGRRSARTRHVSRAFWPSSVNCRNCATSPPTSRWAARL